jgi:hypothetical protein
MSSIHKYREGYHQLLKLARTRGIRIRLVGIDVLKDYVGMNSATAKIIGFPMPANTIYLLKGLPYSILYHTLRHEMDEMWLIVHKGMKYWQAHTAALIDERKFGVLISGSL